MPSEDQVVQFYRLAQGARAPQRADRSAAGTLPTRAFRYCDAVSTATAFGWWVFSPLDVQLLWTGDEVLWTYAGVDGWMTLDAVQFPGIGAHFDAAAPADMHGCAPPFLTALPEPGVVQIWTGLIARTAPDWSLLVRGPANLPPQAGYALYEGVVETDRWFGPLFTNLRLTRTDIPVRLRTDMPLLQVQPVPRAALLEQMLNNVTEPVDVADFTVEDWQSYRRTVVAPNMDPDRRIGQYAVAARKRRACPYAGAAS